jgi:hypothetical protein
VLLFDFAPFSLFPIICLFSSVWVTGGVILYFLPAVVYFLLVLLVPLAGHCPFMGLFIL